MINAVQLKAVKDILDFMNHAWEPPIEGVLSQKRTENKIVPFYAKVDPYFTAYLSETGMWWICVSDYWIWRESYDTLKELCDFVDFKIYPCHIHVIQAKMFKDEAKLRKHVKLFVGQVSWA